jgi:hypothetical protein
LPAGRLAALGATPEFHHGPLAIEAPAANGTYAQPVTLSGWAIDVTKLRVRQRAKLRD